ncbi:hypothetical protein [Bacillus salipaludis]|uniref:Uncharacterized protein n=1 Tax=Bacillus salipaludis TaxID=2547811 RepID=A0ABW8RMM4_9BACI
MIRSIINEWMKLKEAGLVKEIQKIQTVRLDEEEDELVEVDNPTDLSLLSKHEKYAVFRLDENRCILIFAKEGYAEREYENRWLGAKKGISFGAYDWGKNYVVTDYLEATTLQEYLESHIMTRELAEKIIKLLDDLDESGFMTNQAPQDILIFSNESLKVENLKKNLTGKPPFPKKMLKGLGVHAKTFLNFVLEVDKARYEEWGRLPEFQEFVENKE